MVHEKARSGITRATEVWVARKVQWGSDTDWRGMEGCGMK